MVAPSVGVRTLEVVHLENVWKIILQMMDFCTILQICQNMLRTRELKTATVI